MTEERLNTEQEDVLGEPGEPLPGVGTGTVGSGSGTARAAAASGDNTETGTPDMMEERLPPGPSESDRGPATPTDAERGA